MSRYAGRVRITLTGLLVAWLAAGSTSAGSAETSPTPLFSEADFTALDDLVKAAVQDGRTKSAIALLARDDQILWLKTAGEMAPGVPMRPDAILPLASVGKMYTATAAMILVERGRIALEDPVSRYIPEFAQSGITILHLLTHTGGLTVRGDEFWAAWYAHAGRTTTADMARALAALPRQSKPGERFDYGITGASYEVLGAVIEIASGRTLEAFMIESIFRPLGLDDTHFYLPPEKAERLPATYRKVDGALKLDRELGEDFPRSTYFHGGGGVQSSPRDIQRFARIFLNDGAVDGVRILQPESVRRMMSDQLGEKAPQGFTWGLGAAIFKGPSGDTAQYGWTGGGAAMLWVDPGKRLIGYFAFPLTPPGDQPLLMEFRRAVYQAMANSPDGSN